MPLQYFIARQKVEDRGLEGLQVEIGGGFLLAVVSIVLAGKSRVRFRIFFNDVAGIDQCVALADVARFLHHDPIDQAGTKPKLQAA